MENVFRIELNMFGMFICIIVLWMFFHQIKIRTDEDKIFIFITHLTMLALILDCVFWLVDKSTIPFGRDINIIVNTLYYGVQLVACWFWGVYCIVHMDPGKKHIYLRWILFAIFTFGFGMMIVNIWTGCVFKVDGQNVYSRTWGVWGTLQAVCCLIYAVISIIFTLVKMIRGNQNSR